jgi:hypothetical protein
MSLTISIIVEIFVLNMMRRSDLRDWKTMSFSFPVLPEKGIELPFTSRFYAQNVIGLPEITCGVSVKSNRKPKVNKKLINFSAFMAKYIGVTVFSPLK